MDRSNQGAPRGEEQGAIKRTTGKDTGGKNKAPWLIKNRSRMSFQKEDTGRAKKGDSEGETEGAVGWSKTKPKEQFRERGPRIEESGAKSWVQIMNEMKQAKRTNEASQEETLREEQVESLERFRNSVSLDNERAAEKWMEIQKEMERKERKSREEIAKKEAMKEVKGKIIKYQREGSPRKSTRQPVKPISKEQEEEEFAREIAATLVPREDNLLDEEELVSKPVSVINSKEAMRWRKIIEDAREIRRKKEQLELEMFSTAVLIDGREGRSDPIEREIILPEPEIEVEKPTKKGTTNKAKEAITKQSKGTPNKNQKADQTWISFGQKNKEEEYRVEDIIENISPRDDIYIEVDPYVETGPDGKTSIKCIKKIKEIEGGWRPKKRPTMADLDVPTVWMHRLQALVQQRVEEKIAKEEAERERAEREMAEREMAEKEKNNVKVTKSASTMMDDEEGAVGWDESVIEGSHQEQNVQQEATEAQEG